VARYFQSTESICFPLSAHVPGARDIKLHLPNEKGTT